MQALIPKINDVLKPENPYNLRTTALYALQSVAQVSPSDFVIDRILPYFLKSAKDPVANVRFVLAKIFKSIANTLPDKANKQIKQYIISYKHIKLCNLDN